MQPAVTVDLRGSGRVNQPVDTTAVFVVNAIKAHETNKDTTDDAPYDLCILLWYSPLEGWCSQVESKVNTALFAAHVPRSIRFIPSDMYANRFPTFVVAKVQITQLSALM